MRNIPSDIRDAGRLFRRAPLFGAAAVLILALGTGATSAILSLADKALLRPLPIPNLDRVLQSTFSFSYLDFRDLVSEHHGFSQVAAWLICCLRSTRAARPCRCRVRRYQVTILR